MEYGVLSPLLLKVKENPSHDIWEGGGVVASHHHSLSIREQGRHYWFILEIPWSVYQKERGAVDDIMGTGRRGGCLGQNCENSDLGNSLFSKKSLHWSKAWKREIWRIQCDQWVRGLLPPGESKQWLKISGKFSSSEFSCNNFHTLCRKLKIMRVFKQLLEDTARWPRTRRGCREPDASLRTTWPSHARGSPEHTSPSCWSREVAQAEIHRDLSVRGWSLGAAREDRCWWRTPTERHGWEREKFCIKTPFKPLDESGVVVSKGSNHDGVITHLEPDILECEVKWALGSITTNKAIEGDGIPVERFQILEDDAVKVLHSICQQIWKTQQWPQDWKRSVFIPIPKKGNCKECSNYCTIALISHASKVMLKILQARLQ